VGINAFHFKDIGIPLLALTREDGLTEWRGVPVPWLKQADVEHGVQLLQAARQLQPVGYSPDPCQDPEGPQPTWCQLPRSWRWQR
jgi:hypothetical protein